MALVAAAKVTIMFDGENAQAKMLEFDTATAAIIGKREYQDDSVVASLPTGQGSGFAIVADGIGGHAAGDVASSIATSEVFTHLKMHQKLIEEGSVNVPFMLRTAAESANQKLAEHVDLHPETKGMGTTLLVPVIRGDKMSWLSIGDSPLFLLRGGALRQLNKVHSMAPQIDMMVKSGAMSEEKSKDHPDRHALLSVVNGEEIAEIDCPSSPVGLKPGDVIIVASDGLLSLASSVIAKTLMTSADGRSADIVDALLRAVKDADQPNQDNTTIVVIKVAKKQVEESVMDLDAMPVLATAENEAAVQAAPVAAPAAPVVEPQPEPAPEAKPEKDEKKAYWYRGQKYYRD